MNKIIALLTDFGLDDHFVGTMKGVILSQDPDIKIFDISHQIRPQNVLEAAYVLSDTMPYWPEETLFVAVVDPGVGTERRSLWVRTVSGHQIICPDNGLLTIVQKKPGLSVIHDITQHQRMPGSRDFFTFHGRDVYAFNAGRLKAGLIDPVDLGPELKEPIVTLSIVEAIYKQGILYGNIVKVERPFGNLCTNITGDQVSEAGLKYGDLLRYRILEGGTKRMEGKLPLVKTFGEVLPGEALLYLDSSARLGFSINQGHFSDYFEVNAGADWEVQVMPDTSQEEV